MPEGNLNKKEKLYYWLHLGLNSFPSLIGETGLSILAWAQSRNALENFFNPDLSGFVALIPAVALLGIFRGVGTFAEKKSRRYHRQV